MRFDDESLDLYVITTMTNWIEPPRIRHEIARQLSKENNVLFVQLHSQRKVKRNTIKAGPNLLVAKAGFSFPGLTRFFWKVPAFRYIYYKYLNVELSRLLRQFSYRKVILINFQFDYPEVLSLKFWDKSVYFCNDDFVNQQSEQTISVKNKKELIQADVVRKSDLVIAVSDPLMTSLSRYSRNVKVLYSGHDFDLSKSIEYISDSSLIKNPKIIKVCYLGVLNHGIALDWLEFILNQNDMELTIIGPIPKLLKNKFKGFLFFKNFDFLIGQELQCELLNHDVLVMPYSSIVENEVTTVPAKLFQYLAVGKPVVSSVMPNLIKLPGRFVYMAHNKEEFCDLIRTSLNENNLELALHRIDFASKNTWNARGLELQRHINEVAGESL